MRSLALMAILAPFTLCAVDNTPVNIVGESGSYWPVRAASDHNEYTAIQQAMGIQRLASLAESSLGSETAQIQWTGLLDATETISWLGLVDVFLVESEEQRAIYRQLCLAHLEVLEESAVELPAIMRRENILYEARTARELYAVSEYGRAAVAHALQASTQD